MLGDASILLARISCLIFQNVHVRQCSMQNTFLVNMGIGALSTASHIRGIHSFGKVAKFVSLFLDWS
jgi:hypothetical protein